LAKLKPPWKGSYRGIPREQKTRAEAADPNPTQASLSTRKWCSFAFTAAAARGGDGDARGLDRKAKAIHKGMASAGKHVLFGHLDKSCVCFVSAAAIWRPGPQRPYPTAFSPTDVEKKRLFFLLNLAQSAEQTYPLKHNTGPVDHAEKLGWMLRYKANMG
jgi:hypothetical protein